MAMVKIVDPRGWNWDRPIAQLIKVSSRGLRGEDRNALLKTASHEFVDTIDKMKVAKDEEPVHVIALGASEAYGPNRNGDGFKEATCKRRHDTFVKHGRWYRNHKNKDPKKSYGYIKKSAYNDPMRRVELLCMLNKTKEAAERNGGLVADLEIEKLAADEDLPVSMACRVSHDVCSGCGHKARTRDEYCTGSTCKYGGCRENLTKVAADGHILHVDNPDPSWFDMSKVYRGADRIAFGHKADYLQKAASATDFMGGAELAEALGVEAPIGVILGQDQPYMWNGAIELQTKIAYGLSQLEKKAQLVNGDTARSLDLGIRPGINDGMCAILGAPGTEKSSEALGALAEQKIILPLRDFARWLSKSAAVDAASALLPGLFGRLIDSESLQQRLQYSRFAVSGKTASLVQRTLASNLAPSLSFSADAVRERSMLSCIRNRHTPNLKNTFVNEKIASDYPGAVDLAEDYGLYVLAALEKIAAFDQEFMLTGSLVLAQNRIL
jgi:hypothetical protein